MQQPTGPMLNFPEAQARPESIHAEPFMALISLNAMLGAQQEQTLNVFALPPKCVISLCCELTLCKNYVSHTIILSITKTQTKGLKKRMDVIFIHRAKSYT